LFILLPVGIIIAQNSKDMIDTILYQYMNEMLSQTTQEHFRYLHKEIDWRARLIGITGPRGVGKSTMLLQHIKKANEPQSLYVSVDNLYFNNHTIVYLADEFIKEGGKHLYIDEIHKYKGWSQELKQIYDVHPDLQIVFTGSSILDIKKGQADLSRRVLMYHLQGLSFREYLLLFHGIDAPVFTLNDILNQRVSIPNVAHPLPLFREYLSTGYYPFAIEPGFTQRINQVVQQTVDVDIAQFANMKPATTRKLKQMLAIISTLAPYKPNFENLAQEISVSKNNVPDYLVYLSQAGLLGILRDNTLGMRSLGKIEKVYIDNPSLMTAIASGNPDIGNLRETFFYNQMRVNHPMMTASKESDFFISPYTFEIGGKKKGKKQIENVENGRIVKDDIETGHGIVIPLWYFGMNY
jgi:predicted AAA+ superfamily ATPase